MGKKVVAKDYDEIVSANPKVGEFFFQTDWEIMHNSNERLRESFGKMWKRNLRKNLDNLFQKHRTINADLKGIGFNKATIVPHSTRTKTYSKKSILLTTNCPLRHSRLFS